MWDHNIKFELKKKTDVLLSSEYQDKVLAQNPIGIYINRSYSSGIWICNGSMLMDVLVEEEEPMGSNDLNKNKGFAFLCDSLQKSDLNIIVGEGFEDNLYINQFGKYQ